jgi:hypothetical protein
MDPDAQAPHLTHRNALRASGMAAPPLGDAGLWYVSVHAVNPDTVNSRPHRAVSATGGLSTVSTGSCTRWSVNDVSMTGEICAFPKGGCA